MNFLCAVMPFGSGSKQKQHGCYRLGSSEMGSAFGHGPEFWPCGPDDNNNCCRVDYMAQAAANYFD